MHLYFNSTIHKYDYFLRVLVFLTGSSISFSSSDSTFRFELLTGVLLKW